MNLGLSFCSSVKSFSHCFSQQVGLTFGESRQFLRQQHYLLLIDCDPIGFLEVLLHLWQIILDRFLSFFRATKLGMYSKGPGRYRAFMAIKSAKTLGFKSFKYFCIPRFILKNPTVYPFEITLGQLIIQRKFVRIQINPVAVFYQLTYP